MLEALSRTASRYPKRMGLLAILVFVLAGVFGAPAAGMLNARNPFSDPGSQSARAEALVQRLTGKEVSPGVCAIIAARPGTVAVSTVAKAIGAVSGVASMSTRLSPGSARRWCRPTGAHRWWRPRCRPPPTRTTWSRRSSRR